MRRPVFLPAMLLLAFLPAAPAQVQLIQNGGFASPNPTPWVLSGAGISFGNGWLSMGNFSGASQFAYQTVTFPTNLIGATLSLEYGSTSTNPLGDDSLAFYITNTNQTAYTELFSVNSANPTDAWVTYSTNLATYQGGNTLSPYAGQTVDIYFSVATDPTYGYMTSFDITDVSLIVGTTANIPPNDDFTNATVIPADGITNDVNTIYASKEPGEPNHAGNAGGHSVWWTWTSTAIGTVNINTDGSSFDTLLAVYTNSSPTNSAAFSNLTCISSNNGATRSGGQAALKFLIPTGAQVGTQYYITLDGYDGNCGPAVFNFAFSLDTTRPTVAVSSPANNAVVTNSSVLVQGTASDTVAVASVLYSLSNAIGTNAWQLATSTNNWTNWNVTVTNLIPGTNRVTVEAINTSSNVSLLESHVYNYDVAAPLALSVVPPQGGTISGATNGQLLDLNDTYKITAKTNGGFAFAGWTGSIVTNTNVLTFPMSTNLSFTANFLDVQKPVLTITHPTPGERWSNSSTFTITGTAHDNVAVSNVFYQFDGGTNWILATPSNSTWSNWSASVTLTTGLNTVRAHAQDTSGNFSTNTNFISFYYVVAEPLAVTNTGRGTISPDYNTNLLAIGSNYSMTATAAAGFKFTNWTGGTNPPLAVLTNNAKITFTMETNLTLIANFFDDTPPTITVTSPTPNQRWSNSTFFASGTARDNVQVSNVFFQLNNSNGWILATPGNTNWTNWTATLAPLERTNVFEAYSVDTTGNRSPTNKVTFLYIPSALLAVSNIGNGSVTPEYNQKTLAIGTNYTLTATPSNNWLFSNWVGGVTTPYIVLGSNLSYSFHMQSNLFIEANFVTNLFLAAQGNYYGLFAPSDPPRRQTNSGSFTLAVTSAGVGSGDLYLGAEKIPFSKVQFDVGGLAQFVATPSGGKPLTNTLQLDLAGQSVQGTVTDGSFVAVLNGDQAVFTAAHQATNYEGHYTFIIPGTNDPTIGPFGTSFGTVTVSATGVISLVGGSLADGTTGLSQYSGVSKEGNWPFYMPLYNGTGSLWGTNYFTNHTLISAPYLSWINATNSAKGALYRSGFTNEQAAVIGALYTSTNKPLLGVTNAEVILEGGNLAFNIINHIDWASNNTITASTNIVGNTNGLKLSITSSASGLITGSILNPTNKNLTIPIAGVLLQNQSNAAGYFLGTNQSGEFLLTPQ